MKSYLPFVVAGLTNGSIYGLAAVGLVLTYKTSGIFNFAHGAQAALAAYLMYEFRERMGLPWGLAALLAVLLGGVVAGLVLERGAHLLAEAPVAARVAATVGLLVALQGTLVLIFGAASIRVQPFLSQRLIDLPGVTVRVEQFVVTGFVAAAVAVLYLFFTRAKLGLATQGVVDDPALLSLAGTSPIAVRRFAWMVGSCFAAVSGILLAPTIALDAGVLTLLVFFAFGAAAVGRFASLPATYLGGLGIGLGAALLTRALGDFHVTGPLAQLPSNLPFIVLFLTLVLTPKRCLVERGTDVVRRALAPVTFSRRVTALGVSGGLAAALVLPHVVGSRLPLYITGLAYVILFASLSVLVRMSGQVSLCHIAFAAVGASVSARAVGAGVPWLVALALGGVVAAPVGAVVAIPAIRLSGVYLAIATFGFGLVVQRLFYTSVLMFGGGFAIRAPRPRLSGLHTTTDVGYYHVVLAVTIVCLVAMALLRRSRAGRILRAFADSPAAVDAHGLSTNELKVRVFAISAFFAGIAGGLIGPVTGTAAAGSGVVVGGFDFTVSLLLISVLFIAGRQPIISAVIAAALFVVVPGHAGTEFAQDYAPVIFGGVAVAGAVMSGRPVMARIRASIRMEERARQGSQLTWRAAIQSATTRDAVGVSS